jgi:RNA polymerase sigma-70 factor (ECF subfamily)
MHVSNTSYESSPPITESPWAPKTTEGSPGVPGEERQRVRSDHAPPQARKCRIRPDTPAVCPERPTELGARERMALIERLSVQKTLQRRLYRRTRNRDEADDIAQEVYLCLLGIADPSKVRNWEAYVYAVTNNLLCREMRSRARREQGRVDVDDPAIQGELAGSSPGFGHAFDAERYEQRLNEVVAGLSAKCRRVLLLRREGLTYIEVARVVGISTNMVKKYLKQVRVHSRRPAPKVRCQRTRLMPNCK